MIGRCQRRHRQQEFLKFLDHIDATLGREEGVEVHLILDNYGTHKTAAVKRWFLRHPEYHLHFTPTGASWLNLVEGFLAEITEKRIHRGAFRSVRAPEAAIQEYLDRHNSASKPFVRTASADLILSKVKKVCERISNSGHEWVMWYGRGHNRPCPIGGRECESMSPTRRGGDGARVAAAVAPTSCRPTRRGSGRCSSAGPPPRTRR